MFIFNFNIFGKFRICFMLKIVITYSCEDSLLCFKVLTLFGLYLEINLNVDLIAEDLFRF